MKFDSDQSLEHFVCGFLENHGALIEKSSKGFEVILPGHLSRMLQTSEFITIDTDPDTESVYSVNFGSPLLEKMVNTACGSVPLVECNLGFDYIKSQGFDRLIKNQFVFNGAVGKVESFAKVRTEYLYLVCNYIAQSDEEKAGLINLIFNIETGAMINDMEYNTAMAATRFRTKEKAVNWEGKKIQKIITWVESNAEDILKEKISLFENSMNRRFRRDVISLKEYYADLESEMMASIERPGLSDKLIRERQDKIAMLPEELARKTDDLFKKYSIKVKIKLCSAMLIRTPAVKVLYRLSIGRKQQRFSLIYNPANKSMDPMVCTGCGRSIFRVHFCRRYHLLCPDCHRQCPVCSKMGYKKP